MSRFRFQITGNWDRQGLDVAIDVDEDVADEITHLILSVLASATGHQTLPAVHIPEEQNDEPQEQPDD